jgi:hypothetical protein
MRYETLDIMVCLMGISSHVMLRNTINSTYTKVTPWNDTLGVRLQNDTRGISTAANRRSSETPGIMVCILGSGIASKY